MRKIYKESQLLELIKYSREVIECIKDIISILNENYGEERDIDNDLGGYVLVAENIVDIEILRQDKLQGLVPEYTDIIECSEGVNWTSSLFLFSSDYSVVVIAEEKISKILLEE